MKKSIVTIILLVITLTIGAAVRNSEAAAQLALDVLRQSQRSLSRKAVRLSDMKLCYTAMKQKAQEPAFYAFNDPVNGGWAVVSADDRTLDVLCYSDTGEFNYEKANPSFKFWLSRYEEEISNVNDDNTYTSAIRKGASVEAISPLLGKIAWDQETPYYNMCPMDKYDNTRCLTGCVATAMAQIMRMWKWPEHGTGEYTWVWKNYYKSSQKESLYANFGETTYDWDNMLETYDMYSKNYSDEQADAVATLMYHLGVAAHMDYGGDKAGGSGSWTDDMAAGIENYFSYTFDRFVTQYSKSEYKEAKGTDCAVEDDRCEFGISYSAMAEYINADLESGYPAMLGGEDSNGGGHEFVCDGRDTNGKFHINWGWSGDSNCYCALSSLKPSGSSYTFSTNLDALVGIRPNYIEPIHAESVTISPTELTLDMNETATLVADVQPKNASDKKLTWSSSDESVATVDNSGKVTALMTGNCVITATLTSESLTAECQVTVTENTAAATLHTDNIKIEDTGVKSNQYASFADVEKSSGAVYSGVVAKGNDAIQMRAYNKSKATSAIYTTTSGGRLVSVEISWNENTYATRNVKIYASNTAYISPDNVYSNADDVVGIMSYPGKAESTTFTVPEDKTFTHLGIMADGGAVYLNEIVVTWEHNSAPTAIRDIAVSNTPVKVLRDGQLLIRKGENYYDVVGRVYKTVK